MYDQNLQRNAANFAALTPLALLSARPGLPRASGHRAWCLRQTWAQTYARCRQLAAALQHAPALAKMTRSPVILPNTPPMIEAHFGVPMAGAVLNALNTRLDPEAVAFMLDHGEAKALIVDPRVRPAHRQGAASCASAPNPCW